MILGLVCPGHVAKQLEASGPHSTVYLTQQWLSSTPTDFRIRYVDLNTFLHTFHKHYHQHPYHIIIIVPSPSPSSSTDLLCEKLPVPRHARRSTETARVEIREYLQRDDSRQDGGEVDVTQRRNTLGKPLVNELQLTASAVTQNHVNEFPPLCTRP